MSEYIIYESKSDEVTDYLGVKHNVSHIEKREKIVRCRDCKWCMAYMASVYCDYMAHDVELDGFCKWGERKLENGIR